MASSPSASMRDGSECLMDQYIDIVFDGPPSPNSGRFVEVEDANGNSVRVGKWIEREDWVSARGPDGKVQSVQVDVGRFLGIGDRVVTIDRSSFEELPDRVNLRLTGEAVGSLPETQRNRA